MKIDNVILSSNDSKTYLDFWPIVSKAWKNIDIEPILIYTGKKKFPSRITRLDDDNTNFLHLNRSKLGDNFEEFYNPDLKYLDFHMPRPYKKYKNLIDNVYNSNF